MLFWNYARIWNKDIDFSRYVKSFDFINLCETWIEEKDWETDLKDRLSRTHIWECHFARRKGKVGLITVL